MSFLAAIFHRDGAPAARPDIERMARALANYAPGRPAVRMLGPVALAVLAEHYAPEDAGQAQPVLGGGGRFAMIFDGRLDNRAELADALALAPREAARLSDARLTMRAFERWGVDRLDELVGEFAFIVWDEAERRLLIVTDQLGRRGLVYHDRPDRLVVASMVRPIHALPDVPRELNEERLADALSQLVAFQPETLFRGIHSCPPASVTTATADGLRSARYYRLRDRVRPVRYRRDGDYVEAARALFEQAVRACLRSDGPVGAFMSGGLDSASAAVVAADMLAEEGKRLPTFTWVPEPGWDGRTERHCYGDETPYVRMIAQRHPGIEPNLIDSSGRSHYHRQDEFLRLAEMPMRNAGNLHWIHSILEAAAGQGIRVMLQGQGGNLTLSHRGDGIYHELLRSGRLRQLWREARGLGPGPAGIARALAGKLVLSGMPDALWDLKERMRGRPGFEERWLRYGAIRPEFGRATNVPGRARESGFNFFGRPSIAGRAWSYWLIDQAGGIAATAGAAFRAMYRIDQRDPFMDRRLVEWCFGVPESQYHRDGAGRWLIRRMMRGRLPPEVLHKPRDVGRQTSDWHLRMSRDLNRMKADLAAMAEDPELGRMIDIGRLQAMLDDWPAASVTEPGDYRRFYLPVNVPMAMQIGRFVQIERGANRTTVAQDDGPPAAGTPELAEPAR